MTHRLPAPVKKTTVKKTLISLCLVSACGSCTPDAYQKDADLQVGKLLSDRKQQTLGYTPKTVASEAPVAPPTKKSYASIPATPVPLPQPSPMEPSRFEL